MPRPKPKTSSPVFMATDTDRGPLPDSVRAQLLTLLGYQEFNQSAASFDPEAETMRHQCPGHRIAFRTQGHPVLIERDPNVSPSTGPAGDVHAAILDVEAIIDLYHSGAPQLDAPPRATDYLGAFKPVQRKASDLLDTLSSWTGYYRDQFKLKGADINAIERELASLVNVSNAVVEDFKKMSSKGARKNTALIVVILRLREVFRKYYQGERAARERKGAFEQRPLWEKQEFQFVQTALRVGRIIPEGYRELPRLFRDPRCMPSEAPPPEQKGSRG